MTLLMTLLMRLENMVKAVACLIDERGEQRPDRSCVELTPKDEMISYQELKSLDAAPCPLEVTLYCERLFLRVCVEELFDHLDRALFISHFPNPYTSQWVADLSLRCYERDGEYLIERSARWPTSLDELCVKTLE